MTPDPDDAGTADTGEHAASAPAAIAAGDRLAGRYQVGAALGRGGMGEVYQVHDDELDEEVALKLLRSELSRDASYRQRLRGEVRLARRVSHPNVCRVHDIGVHGERLFVTMELVRGESLRAILRAQHRGEAEVWPLATAVDVFVQVASALAAAHRAGVLHRDIKPDNVIVEDGRAVLTDFGVASLTGDAAGVVAGTPSYVAPEILRGEPFDQRADVYSATVLAYELLAGRTPFPSRSFAGAVRRARAPSPPPPLPVMLGPAQLREALERVLAHGLESDPGRRFASIDRLAEGLAAAARGGDGDAARGSGSGEPVHTESPPTPTSARRREVRVATLVRIECESVREASHAGAGEPTELVPFDGPDELERIVVGLGGVPQREMTFVFGAPVALGDDAVRAVRAAHSLLARTVAGRAGIDTVRVLVRPGGEPIAADAFRLADALAAAAQPGEILLSAAAARQVAAHVEVTSAPDVAGQRALRVRGDAAVAGAVAPAAQVRPRELARLEALARGCFESRTPTAVEVHGPAGSGKSRLREALVARIAERREVDWLIARAAPLGEASPLSLLRAADPDWADAALRGDTHRGAILAAARRWIETRATRRPVAVVFDDVQWADELSRAVIADLAIGLDAVPVLAIAFARDDSTPSPPGVYRVELGPLDDDTALRLARAVAPAAADDALADVVARAGGNPYFVEELAREQVERGDVALPATVEAAVQAHLDRLTPHAIDVIAAGAVVGRAFWRDAATAALADKLDDADLDAALAELERAGLVRPAAPATVDDDRYEFVQAVVRDVAYQRLPARDRRRAHVAVARWLETRAGGLRSPDPDVLYAIAHHRDHGGEPAGAAEAWRLAGTRCLELSSARQAHGALARAWELSPRNDPALALQLGEAALDAVGAAAATDAFRDALALTPEGPARARVYLRLGEAAAAAAAHARAIEHYEAGLAAVAPDDTRLAASLHASIGWVLAYQLNDPRGLASCERAVQLLEGTPHRRDLARALSRLGGAYMRAGRWTEQLGCNRRNLEIAQELGDRDAEVTARINLGVVLANLGELDAAIAHTEEALAICRRSGRRATEGLCASNLAGYLLERGDLDAAASRLADGMRLLERTGSTRVLPESHTFAARIAARRGQLDAATAAARESLALSRELALDFDIAIAQRLLAQLEVRRGHPAAARAALDQAAVGVESDPFERARLDAARARVLARAGDPDAAAARARAAEVFARLGAKLDLAALDDPDEVR